MAHTVERSLTDDNVIVDGDVLPLEDYGEYDVENEFTRDEAYVDELADLAEYEARHSQDFLDMKSLIIAGIEKSIAGRYHDIKVEVDGQSLLLGHLLASNLLYEAQMLPEELRELLDTYLPVLLEYESMNGKRRKAGHQVVRAVTQECRTGTYDEVDFAKRAAGDYEKGEDTAED